VRGFTLAVFLASISATFAAEKPFLDSELIFPLETWHNHSSSLVELPHQDLLVCWYHGSGERTIADTPGFPDTKPSNTGFQRGLD